MIYVVLGMHKSGTTLLSQVLHHSGIAMGEFDENESYDRGNKYERQECLRLNMRLLGTADFGVLDVPREALRPATPAEADEMAALVAAAGRGGGDWGFKDPRTCLTYGEWAGRLGDHRLIAVFREPSQVWPRFKWQGRRRYHTNFQRAVSYLARWHEYNEGVLAALERAPGPSLVLDYHDFMVSDDAFDRLERFVGRRLEDRRDPAMYRSREGSDLFLRAADRWLTWRSGRSIAGMMARLRRRMEVPA
ncbi:sulfotransferase [bacterium]|nr:sulfotransferase [bacterium]